MGLNGLVRKQDYLHFTNPEFKNGVFTVSVKEDFNFITDVSFTIKNIYLKQGVLTCKIKYFKEGGIKSPKIELNLNSVLMKDITEFTLELEVTYEFLKEKRTNIDEFHISVLE